jgi:hypothetical protein
MSLRGASSRISPKNLMTIDAPDVLASRVFDVDQAILDQPIEGPG